MAQTEYAAEQTLGGEQSVAPGVEAAAQEAARRASFGERHSGELAALLVVTIWGTNFVFLKLALGEFSVAAFTFLRYLGMLALGWGVLLWRARATGRSMRVARADLRQFALSGVLGFTLYISLSMIGLSYSSAFSNALLIAIAPIFVALLLWARRLERIGAAQALGMMVSFLGIAVFVAKDLRGGLGAAGLGDLINLAAAFFYAAYNVANKPLIGRYPALVVTAYTLTFGGVPVVLACLPALFTQHWGAVSAGGWATLAWSMVAPVYVAWTIWSWAGARIGVARTAMFMYLVPLISGVTAWLLLGEEFGLLKILGAALTLGGLALARRVGK
jgi:drug/metabolite transporter (DMT)-like permease